MDIYTIDFETYYDSDYTLTKLKTEEYVRDPRFEAQCVGISRNGGEPICVPKPQIEAVFAKIPWHEIGVLCQNTLFDGFILAERYGIRAQFYFDTKAIFNREYPHEKATLYNIARVLRLYTQKGEMNSKGKHFDDFTPAELDAHMRYCKDDVRATWQAWQKLKGSMNLMELQLIDLTIKWFCFPQLILDPAPLLEEMAAEHARKTELLTKIAEMDEVTEHALTVKSTKALREMSIIDRAKKQIMSNPQLAAILDQLGVDVPIKAAPAQIKKSPELKQYVEDYNHWLLVNDFAVNEKNIHITSIDTDGEPEYGEEPAYPWTYAFAKNDTNFKHLIDHPDERVSMLVEARIGCKSTLNESRSKTLYGISQRGAMPVPLIYWGAAPGRWSGTQGINLQNLTRGSRLRSAICAPPGYHIVVCDLSAIEARVNAWFSGQQDAVNIFAQNGDIYCVMAESLYGRKVTKADKQERRLGKTVILGCIAEGEKVFTDHGLAEIQDVTIDMRVWDGVEFVPHTGVIYQGDKEVMTYDGLTATPDHVVFLRDGRTCELSEAAQKNYRLARTEYGGTPIQYVADTQPGTEAYGQADFNPVPMFMRAYPMGRQVELTAEQIAWLSEVHGPDEQAYTEFADAWAQVRCDNCEVQQPKEPEVQGLWGAWHRVPLWLSRRVRSLRRAVSSTFGLQGAGDRSGEQQRALRAGEFTTYDESGAANQSTFDALVKLQRAESATSPCVPCIEDNRLECPLFSVDCGESCAQVTAKHRRDHSPLLYAGIKQTKRTYDITNAGHRHRFTVSGHLVHNCGYGMSWKRFYDYVINAPEGAIIFGQPELVQFGLSVEGFLANRKNAVFVKVNRPRHWDERAFAVHCCVCDYIIKVYRTANYAIKAQWDDCKRALPDMLSGYEREVGAVDGVVYTAKDKLITPNNRILYPGLASKDGKEYTRRTRDGIGHLNGSLLTENIVQHLSRQIMAEQTLEAVRCGLNVVFTCHDEIVCLERESEAEAAYKQLEQIMSTAPAWAPGLPVACEGGTAQNYGEAK